MVCSHHKEGGCFVPRELAHVRIGEKWYYQDSRLSEFRNINNPHDRITFQEFQDKGLTIDENRVFVGNFEIADWALNVRCRVKGHRAYVLDIGRGHWGVCDNCRTRIFLGSNLASAWRSENKEIWKERHKKIADYRCYAGSEDEWP